MGRDEVSIEGIIIVDDLYIGLDYHLNFEFCFLYLTEVSYYKLSLIKAKKSRMKCKTLI